MALSKDYNLARMTSSSTGTSRTSIALTAAATGMLTFANAGASNGDIISYGIEDGSNSEAGQCQYNFITGVATLSNFTVESSTNSNAAISLSGSQEIFITVLKRDLDALVRTVKRQTFSAGGTYTPSSGMLYCIAKAYGGGGAGGGVTGASGFTGYGGGGAPGGKSEALLTTAQIGASKAVTIGAAGTGVSGAAGNSGGATSLGSLVIANGGPGGSVVTSSNIGAAAGSASAGTGDIAPPGKRGGPSLFYSSSTILITPWAGWGGDSDIGAGGAGTDAATSTTAGNAASGFAAGGGGAGTQNSAASAAGGNGTGGFLDIIEFCSQ